MVPDRSDPVSRGTLIAAVFACGITIAPAALAQDRGPIVIGEHEKMKFFKLDHFQASLDAYWRYRSDETKPATGRKTHDTETLYRESLLLSGDGYFGHPNLVKLDFDTRLQLSQEEFNSDTLNRNERTSENINEFDVRALVLQRSNTPLTIFSRRSQILLDRQFAESLDSITTEYGANLTLRSGIMPSQFQYIHREQEQTGRFSGTDSKLNQDTIAWHGRIRPVNGHRLWWDYTFSNVEESGLLQVPNSFQRHDAFLNHLYDFGSEAQHNLRTSLRFYKETGKFPIDRFRWDESLRLRHTPKFETKYDYSYDQQKRSQTNQTLHRSFISFRHELYDSLTTTGQIGASILDLTQSNFQSTQYFGDLGADYRKIVPLGTLFVTADVNFNRQEDSESGSSIQVSNVPNSFGVSDLIVINRRNIIASSIAITDLTGVSVFSEGPDYSVRVFGNNTEIRRVLGGNIASGQTVMISYLVGPEPANTTDTMGFGTTVRYRFEEGPLKGLSPYIRYRNQSQNRSGEDLVNLPKNDFQDLVIGTDYDFWRISMTAEHQIHDSTLSPFETTRLEGRYSQQLNQSNSLSVSAYYQDTDRVDEDLRTAISNVTARWNAKLTQQIRSNIVGIWRREEDSAGTDSNAFDLKLDMTWQYRQTMVYCTLQNTIVNSNTRDSTFQTFLVGIKRDF